MSFLLSTFRLWERIRTRAFTFACQSGFAELGKGTSIVPPARISGEGRIVIGARVYIGSHSWLQVLGPALQGDGPAIQIGTGSSFSGFCTISAAESIVIEPRVLIARYVYISDHQHEFRFREQAILDQGIAKVAPVRICEGAWLGQSVVVCPGVTIGRNSVVGANSIVRHDVPPYSVAAGAPAKVIRQIDRGAEGQSV